MISSTNGEIRVEAIQAIQDADGQIPLVEGKRTLLRLYFPQLEEFNPGFADNLSLQVNQGTAVAPTNADQYRSSGYNHGAAFRLNLNNSLNFTIPTLKNSKNNHLHLVLSNGRSHRVLENRHTISTHSTRKPLMLNVIGYRYDMNQVPASLLSKEDPRRNWANSERQLDGFDWQPCSLPARYSVHPDPSHMMVVPSFIERIFPVSRVVGTELIVEAPIAMTSPFPSDLPFEVNSSLVNAVNQGQHDPSWDEQSQEDAANVAYQFALQRYLSNITLAHLTALRCNDMWLGDDKSLVESGPFDPSTLYYGLFDGDTSNLRGSASFVPATGDFRPDAVSFGLAENEGSYAAHELAHALGQLHPGYPNEGNLLTNASHINDTISLQEQEDETFANGLGPEGEIAKNPDDSTLIGFDFGLFDRLQRCLSATDHYELMTYHEQLWISPSTQENLLKTLSSQSRFKQSSDSGKVTLIGIHDLSNAQFEDNYIRLLYCFPGVHQSVSPGADEIEADIELRQRLTINDQPVAPDEWVETSDIRPAAYHPKHGVFRICVNKARLANQATIELRLKNLDPQTTNTAADSFDLSAINSAKVDAVYADFDIKHGYEIYLSLNSENDSSALLVVECQLLDQDNPTQRHKTPWRTVLCQSVVDWEIESNLRKHPTHDNQHPTHDNQGSTRVFIDRRIFGGRDQLNMRIRLVSGLGILNSEVVHWNNAKSQSFQLTPSS